MGTIYVASSGLDQSTNHHDNTDVKDNDDSQSYETPRKKFSYSYFGDTITTTATLKFSTLTSPGKEYLCFKIKEKGDHSTQCAKSRASIKVLKSIFKTN